MGSAEFSTCGLHRYRLDRWWSDEPRALVCMRNPSTAGADRNDPTICRCARCCRGGPASAGSRWSTPTTGSRPTRTTSTRGWPGRTWRR
ncbi:DUF1643 domain-containing protein [Methylobacterium sp. 17Sr1-1]|uniref:DUF1643 domain-containing protein n=1 Tax=Methylobacterium sp. 17Sr1-1 TaxID=2202826 RepID=UPI0032AFEC1E